MGLVIMGAAGMGKWEHLLPPVMYVVKCVFCALQLQSDVQ